MKTRQIVTLALITALNVAVARIFLIPVAFTHGNINLCDAGIVFSGLVFGARGGALVGGLSGFLLDQRLSAVHALFVGDPWDTRSACRNSAD